MKNVICAATLLAATAGLAQASFVVSFDDAMTHPDFDTTLPVGTGIGNGNFVVARNTGGGIGGTDIEIGIKAHERFLGELSNSGARYFSDAGFSPVSASNSTPDSPRGKWNITFAYNFNGIAMSNYDVVLRVDFDRAFGAQSWVTLDLDLASLPANPNIGAASQNPGFGFWGASIPGVLDASGYLPYDATQLGEYDVQFIVYAKGTTNELARADMVVEVIPAPGAMALLGLGGLAAARRPRA
jgi:hypothetical protein